MVLHWYITEKEYFDGTKKKKKKQKNIWKEVLELQNQFKTALLVKAIDEIIDLWEN